MVSSVTVSTPLLHSQSSPHLQHGGNQKFSIFADEQEFLGTLIHSFPLPMWSTFRNINIAFQVIILLCSLYVVEEYLILVFDPHFPVQG